VTSPKPVERSGGELFFHLHFGSQAFFRNDFLLDERRSIVHPPHHSKDLGFATQDRSWCALIGFVQNNLSPRRV